MQVTDNIKYVDNRFFVDIATSGCGSGCIYCYIKGSNEKQILMDECKFKESLQSIKNSSYFVKGKQGSIISLCPNTEPFKSKESSQIIKYVLESLLPLGNPIQISTKELIPIEILEFAQKNCIHEKQVYINISTSCISKANIIEPNASPIEVRFNNFEIIKNYNKLTSCIYIKPFTQNTWNDLDKYIELINIYMPDVACIGIDFKKNTILEEPCDLLYHSKDIVDKAFHSDIKSKIISFREKIKDKTLIPVFHSSTCIISKFCNHPINSNIKTVAPELCVQCNVCSY